ncbi:MAG: hypothetical protein HY271_19350 [Deltaproteobacteria bacterium]|nr:hypothetical protein [Deltaproteobacteria bacterium]
MSELGPAVHASENTSAGVATLSDIVPADIDAFVRYWHAGVADLEFLGIDPVLLGTPDDTRQRFRCAIRSGDPSQRSIAFAIKVDGALVGYTLLNRYTPEINYSHWHITEPRLRASGISTALYPHRIKTYFDAAAMKRLIHQTRTRNVGVNRMLDKYVAIAETCYVARPDGVAGPGDFHLRYVYPRDVPEFFKRAVALRRSTAH